MKKYSNFLNKHFIFLFFLLITLAWTINGEPTPPTPGPNPMDSFHMPPSNGVPELPGGSLYFLLGGAGGALIWIRSFFKK